VPGRTAIIFIAGFLVLSGLGVTVYFLQKPAPGNEAPVLAPPGPAQPAEAPAPEVAPRPARPAATPERPADPVTAPPPAEPAPATGALRVESDVPDTSVFVDRVFLGTAPVTKTDLAPGRHTVLLSPTGYESISEVVEVTAGEERAVSVSFKAIRLDTSIAVVHKHAFGSCEGTLRATPAGLAYETTNRNDGFTVAFGNLETFDVDYLNKNLRVKIRNGKTYNFTDPDGNADRLFVFHRDVDKVRERIAGGGS
jgi:hypothetical protein